MNSLAVIKMDGVDAILDSDLTATQKLLLLALLAGDAKGVPETPATLAKKIGRSSRQVRRLLSNLESLGTVIKRHAERGFEYRSAPSALWKSSTAPTSEVPNSADEAFKQEQQRQLERLAGVLWCLKIRSPTALLNHAVRAGRSIDEIEAAITHAYSHRNELGDVGLTLRVKLYGWKTGEAVEDCWYPVKINRRFKWRARS